MSSLVQEQNKRRFFSENLFVRILHMYQRHWAQAQAQQQALMQVDDYVPLFDDVRDEIYNDQVLAQALAKDNEAELKALMDAYVDALVASAETKQFEATEALVSAIESGDVSLEAEPAMQATIQSVLSVPTAMRVAQVLSTNKLYLVENQLPRPQFTQATQTPDAIYLHTCHPALHQHIQAAYARALTHRQAGRHDELRTAISQVFVYTEMAQHLMRAGVSDEVATQCAVSQLGQLLSIYMTQLAYMTERPALSDQANDRMPFADVMQAGVFSPSFRVAMRGKAIRDEESARPALTR